MTSIRIKNYGKINKDKVDEHLENVIEYLEGLKEK